MRRAALSSLLVRPRTIGLADLLVLAAIPLLFAVGGVRQPAAFIEASFLVCGVMGTLVGGSIAEPARCSFAWTLPRYRRALLGEFVLCGAVVCGVAGLGDREPGDRVGDGDASVADDLIADGPRTPRRSSWAG